MSPVATSIMKITAQSIALDWFACWYELNEQVRHGKQCELGASAAAMLGRRHDFHTRKTSRDSEDGGAVKGRQQVRNLCSLPALRQTAFCAEKSDLDCDRKCENVFIWGGLKERLIEEMKRKFSACDVMVAYCLAKANVWVRFPPGALQRVMKIAHLFDIPEKFGRPERR